MKTIQQKVVQLMVGCFLIFASGCYPIDDISTSDRDLVITTPDAEVNFSSYQTFALPDTVVKVTENESRSDEIGPFDQVMLDLVRSNVEALGYREEINPASTPPDLLVFIAVQEATFKELREYPIWDWWGWWGGWFSGWGLGSGWSGISPSFSFFSNYKVGTIYITMIDPTKLNASNKEVSIVWNATLNGLVVGSDASIETRIRTNINQAFKQSPYLGR